MKKLIIILPALLFFIGCQNKNETKSTDDNSPAVDSAATTDINYYKVDLIQVTDSAWGSVTKNTNYEDLLSIYGEQSVKDERICGPECIDSLDVTQVYPGTEKAFTIYWKEKRYHQKIDMIICDTEMSPYRTASDIGIGSSLQDLLELNGRQISFYGFGWDYSGGIISFNGGRLEKSRIHYNLEMPYDSTGNALLGDRELNTGMPDVQKRIANIFVNKLILSFP
ncbi:MAG TPA: hypothetical protein VFV31_06290 [Chitinophagaceae bacterium]|nr:hypothetical protein [Chitinophagaceae bacterium]